MGHACALGAVFTQKVGGGPGTWINILLGGQERVVNWISLRPWDEGKTQEPQQALPKLWVEDFKVQACLPCPSLASHLLPQLPAPAPHSTGLL